MKIFLTIIFLAVCIGLTAIVLMQEGKAAGLGSIGGIGAGQVYQVPGCGVSAHRAPAEHDSGFFPFFLNSIADNCGTDGSSGSDRSACRGSDGSTCADGSVKENN